jgi:alkaline phosphatase
MRTYPASGPNGITDSAAAGTALATGRKVNNGVLSLALPGNGQPLETILEHLADQGKLTGLVSTSTITHATPASFASHVRSRNRYDQIAEHMLKKVRPNVLFGAAGAMRKKELILGMTTHKAKAAGYEVVINREQMDALGIDSPKHVSGQFYHGSHIPYYYDYLAGKTRFFDDDPRLHEMASKAIELLDRSDKGFFLMVEGARIDHAGHGNHIQRNIHETLEFDRTVQAVMEWAKGRDDTLVIVTADHECGGLRVEKSAGKGQIPVVSWSTGNHTNLLVPIYAWGLGSEQVRDVVENTDVYLMMKGESITPIKFGEIPADQVPHLPPPRKPAKAAKAAAYGK